MPLLVRSSHTDNVSEKRESVTSNQPFCTLNFLIYRAISILSNRQSHFSQGIREYRDRFPKTRENVAVYTKLNFSGRRISPRPSRTASEMSPLPQWKHSAKASSAPSCSFMTVCPRRRDRLAKIDLIEPHQCPSSAIFRQLAACLRAKPMKTTLDTGEAIATSTSLRQENQALRAENRRLRAEIQHLKQVVQRLELLIRRYW